MKLQGPRSRAPWGATVLCIPLLLSGCGGGEPAETAPTQAAPAAPAAAPAPTPVTPVAGAGTIEVAETALREQRLFTPAGDNAFELFILALEANPESRQAKFALTDLFPYAVLHVEQRTAARDAEEARRVLDLMYRAQPDAPALERLERDLERLERRLAQEAATAATAAARPAPPTAQTPTPAPTPAPPEPEPTPTPTPSPPPQAAPATPTPAPTQPPPAPTPAPASPAPALPKIVRQPSPRYPEQAMRQGIEGSVTLDFLIEADGSVGDVRVVEASPSGVFEREAIQAIRRARFEPPGQPVRARRTIDFSLGR
jgi:periplasmic protein TonB